MGRVIRRMVLLHFGHGARAGNDCGYRGVGHGKLQGCRLQLDLVAGTNRFDRRHFLHHRGQGFDIVVRGPGPRASGQYSAVVRAADDYADAPAFADGQQFA